MQSPTKARFLDRTTPPHVSTLILLAGLSALTMSIFLPSLNGMTEDFGTSYAIMQLSVSGYLAATAILQIMIGPISDRFGRRPILLVSLVAFTLATIGCTCAPTIEIFLFFRMLQAVVATGMVLSRAIVRDLFPQDQAASVIGYVTMGMALVPMIGPMIGGALDEIAGWRASFVLLAAAGLLVTIVTWRDLGETLSSGGLGFAAQLRGYPALIASPRFWGYALCAAFGSGAFFALLGGASFVAGSVFDLSPLLTGLALGSPAIGYAIGNGLSGRYTMRHGINRMALTGSLLSSAGMGLSLLLTLLGLSHPLAFFGFCTFLGVGNGLMMPSATAGLLSVRPQLAGTASGLGGAIMIGGGAGLSALAGALLNGGGGTMPLQVIMFVTSALGAVAILLVIRRERRLGLA